MAKKAVKKTTKPAAKKPAKAVSKPVKKAAAKKPAAKKSTAKTPAKKVVVKPSKPAKKQQKPVAKPAPKKTPAKAKPAPAKAAPSKKSVKPAAKPVAKAKQSSATATKVATPIKKTSTAPVKQSKPAAKEAPSKAAPSKNVQVKQAPAKPLPAASKPAAQKKAPVSGKKGKAPVPKRDTTGLPILRRHVEELPDPKPKKEIRTSKHIKFELEYFFNASNRLLYEFISTPSGLQDWFADDVRPNRDGTFSFIWEHSEQKAVILYKRENQIVRFKWVDEPSDTYFEFRIEVDDITGDVALHIIDFAEDQQSVETAKMLWDSQINALKHAIGAY